jgi:hypothetical protein
MYFSRPPFPLTLLNIVPFAVVDAQGCCAQFSNVDQFAPRESTYALTVSKASAAFVNRLAAKYSSACRKKKSRSASVANSIATPLTLSGESVGVVRKSLHLNPRSPGNVAHPSW